MLKTDILKKLLKTAKNTKTVMGGDDKQSKLVLLPIKDVFSSAEKCLSE